MDKDISPETWSYTNIKVQKSFWARLPFGLRMAIGAASVLLPLAGAVAGAVQLIGDPVGATWIGRRTPTAESSALPSTVYGFGRPPGGPAAATGMGPQPLLVAAGPATTPAAGRAPDPGAVAGSQVGGPSAAAPVGVLAPGVPAGPLLTDPGTAPAVVVSTVSETRQIAYPTRIVRDRDLPRRVREVREPGAPGVRTLTYQVTTTDGRVTDKKLISDVVSQDPVARIVAVGPRGRAPTECDAGPDDCSGRGAYPEDQD